MIPMLTVGDTGPVLEGTVNADLVGAELEVHIVRPDLTVIEREATGGEDGAWTAELVEGDLTMAGQHLVEVEVTYSNGKTQTFAKATTGMNVWFHVREQYA